MDMFKQSLTLTPAFSEQLNLFRQAAQKQPHLSAENCKIVAWAAAMASQDKALITLVRNYIGELNQEDKRLIITATTRMAVTNPYFMSRNVHPLQAGGTLTDLNMRPFQDLGIDNAIGYHYACIAISLINQGFACFNSHLSSLKMASETDKAIDQALRLVASLTSMKQALFNQQVFDQ
ncbi:MAG: hypothetical protein ACPGUD_14315 [Parashewanella sp.]